jgi:hypothetical protein
MLVIRFGLLRFVDALSFALVSPDSNRFETPKDDYFHKSEAEPTLSGPFQGKNITIILAVVLSPDASIEPGVGPLLPVRITTR